MLREKLGAKQPTLTANEPKASRRINEINDAIRRPVVASIEQDPAFEDSFRSVWDIHLLPNVKDEPRRELARRVQDYDSPSAVSFRSSFGRTRRDRSRRWLWRLVSRFSDRLIDVAMHCFGIVSSLRGNMEDGQTGGSKYSVDE